MRSAAWENHIYNQSSFTYIYFLKMSKKDANAVAKIKEKKWITLNIINTKIYLKDAKDSSWNFSHI